MPKLINQLSKYGADDVFILTARAKESAPAILDFVNGQIDIYNESHNANLPHLKLKNIVGLGESEGKFKAQWIEENLIKRHWYKEYIPKSEGRGRKGVTCRIGFGAEKEKQTWGATK